MRIFQPGNRWRDASRIVGAALALLTLSQACSAPKVRAECTKDADCTDGGAELVCVASTCQPSTGAGGSGTDAGDDGGDASSAGRRGTGGRAGTGGAGCVSRPADRPDSGNDGCLFGAIRPCICGEVAGEQQCNAEGTYGVCLVGDRPCATCPPSPGGQSPLTLVAPVAQDAFCIDQREATQREYARFLGARGRDTTGQAPMCAGNGSFEPSAGCFDAGDDPVTCIDWCDAAAFCAWQGKRLCGRMGGGALPADACSEASEWHVAEAALDLSGMQDEREWIDACTGSTQRRCQVAPDRAPLAQEATQTSLGVRCCADALPASFTIDAGTGGSPGAGGVSNTDDGGPGASGGADATAPGVGGTGLVDAATSND